MNPTLVGLFSIFVWGLSAPIVRIISAHIGVYAYLGLLFSIIGALGFAYHFWRKTRWDKAIFRNRFFYGRWFFFCLHTLSFVLSVALVQIEYLPLVILINYLWPTAVILYSVLFSAVKITRWPAFLLGLCIVFASLSSEIAGELLFSSALSLTPQDYMAFVVVFLGANAWGIYSALSRKAAEETGGGTVIPIFQLTVGAFLPYALLAHPEGLQSAPLWVYAAVGCYAIFSLLAYLSWDLGMRKGNVVILSLAADLIPWISLTAAWLLLDVEIGYKTVLTAIFLVCGATIARYGTLRLGTGLFGTKSPPAEAS